jgi:monoamine oxidase
MAGTSTTADVVVIGAGVTGLAAARVLTEAGLSVNILEARDRVGGRIDTRRHAFDAYPIEVGAEFVQGLPPVLIAYVRQMGALLAEVQGPRWLLRPEGATLHPTCGPLLDDALQQFVSTIDADRPFRDFLDLAVDKNLNGSEYALAASRVEEYDAAHADRISSRALARQWLAEDRIEGHRAFRLVGGYDQLVGWLKAAIVPERSVLHLNAPVASVSWRPGDVQVSTAGLLPVAVEARRAIVTIPLGVLRAPPGATGAVQFDPPVPHLEHAVSRLESGSVVKVVLHFKHRFWDDVRSLGSGPEHSTTLSRSGFMHAHGQIFPVWWTSNPFYAPVLTAWSAGPSAEELSALSDDAVVDRAIEAAGAVFRLGRGAIDQLLDGWFFHNWQADPFARGAYSYIATHGLDAQELLVRPVAGTLYFAGEATERYGHNAMVHGALAEGERVARRVLTSLH